MERKRIVRHGQMCGSSDRTRANCAHEMYKRNEVMRPKLHLRNGVRIKCCGEWVTITMTEYLERKESFKDWKNIEVC